MKKCFKCGEIKPLACFYKHKKMADGHLNKCIDCNKKDVHEYRVANIDKIRAYDRYRGKTEKRIKQNIVRTRNTRRKNPQKAKAWAAVDRAVRAGKLAIQPCEVCGTTERIHRHHKDYSKPLDVVYLCAVHHRQEHK